VNTNLPVQAKAEALRWAVSLAVEHKLIKVCIEGDCQTCIQAINNSEAKVPWRIRNIISEIKLSANHVQSFFLQLGTKSCQHGFPFSCSMGSF
jgi:hypothetical protein